MAGSETAALREIFVQIQNQTRKKKVQTCPSFCRAAGVKSARISVRRKILTSLCVGFLFGALRCAADATNASTAFSSPSLPDAGPSLLRVLGALALVLGLFLGGVWVFRNGRQLALRRGRAPRLNVLETRSLGGRQAVFVVGYDQERFLLGASPSGISLLSHLPAETEQRLVQANESEIVSFPQTLAHVLKSQFSSPPKARRSES